MINGLEGTFTIEGKEGDSFDFLQGILKEIEEDVKKGYGIKLSFNVKTLEGYK